MPPNPPDFSSQSYWSTRFKSETSFEWLVQSNEIIPLILDALPGPSDGDKRVNVLHIGCGTSSLGAELNRALKEHLALRDGIDAPEVKVVDTDYVVPLQYASPSEGQGVEFRQCDILDVESLGAISPEGWDLVVDKSTADAISCGPSLPIDGPGQEGDGSTTGTQGRMAREPIEVMCENLGRVTQRGSRWVCVSYSETRFDHLSRSTGGEGQSARWKVLQKQGLKETTGQRVVKDGDTERIVYEPSTSVWAYVLERI